MSTKTHRINAERLGRWIGSMWGRYLRREQQACGWLVAQGLPPAWVKILLWFVKFCVLALLLYGAFWLALLFMLVIGATLVAHNSDDDDEEWAIGEQAEHKNNPGYDPIIYNDTPDPRFDDE